MKPNRIKRNNEDLHKPIARIQSTVNPFDETVNDENLYCITTGFPASTVV